VLEAEQCKYEMFGYRLLASKTTSMKQPNDCHWQNHSCVSCVCTARRPLSHARTTANGKRRARRGKRYMCGFAIETAIPLHDF
jgi:hypothetical protein